MYHSWFHGLRVTSRETGIVMDLMTILFSLGCLFLFRIETRDGHRDEFHKRRVQCTSAQDVLMLALLTTTWIPDASVPQSRCLRKCNKELQADLNAAHSWTTLFFDPAARTAESLSGCAIFHVTQGAEIHADVNAQVLSFAERENRCLSIASTDVDVTWFSGGAISPFQIRHALTQKTLS